jgi:hypothetical protein
MNIPSILIAAILLSSASASAADTPAAPAAPAAEQPFCVSGIYPHLAITGNLQTEVGISGVAPWAGKLWFIHYFAGEGKQDGAPHLWSLTDDLKLEPHGKYYGGSIASRLIHDETGQLMLGPYLIDKKGNIREFKVYPDMGGKHVSAVAKDLKDPNKIHIVGLSNERWSVDIGGTETPLRASRLTEQLNINEISKPVHGFTGWHGKGMRSGQGVIVYASNGGGSWPAGAGSLYEWDGIETSGPKAPGFSVDETNKHWKLIRRIQVDEVTGPGGIHGAKDPNEPIWVMGWDYRSALLLVRDAKTGWHTYRIPKGSHTHGSISGYYKEWPRIRDVGMGNGNYLMNENGMMYQIPATFKAGSTGGLQPISTFLKMIVDYADWNGRIVMGCNDSSAMGHRLCGRVNSNLMFVEKKDLPFYGQRPSGFGGVWCNDATKAGVPSDPFLIQGFEYRTLHLRHASANPVTFTVEIDAAGNDAWTPYKTITVPANGYAYDMISSGLSAEWMRVRTDADAAGVSAYFDLENRKCPRDPELAKGLATVEFTGARSDGVIRTCNNEEFPLGFAANIVNADGKIAETGYYRISANMTLAKADDATDEAALLKEKPTQEFQVDKASVIVRDGKTQFRLPKGSAAFDKAGATGWFRGRREVVTERWLMNVHGTFYEVPRNDAGGMRGIRPITTHNLGIYDFTSWRGMLVFSGVMAGQPADGAHYRASIDGKVGLWFGNVDDLWRLGPPSGKGGPWFETKVAANEASDPYLMFGYLNKSATIWHEATTDVNVTVEVDFQADNTWSTYATLKVPAGQKLVYQFPEGYAAHWVRLKADKPCTISAQFDYRNPVAK